MALSLKVYLVANGQMKTMRFMQDLSISEVCHQIREKHEIGGPDHGIFQPEVSGKSIGRWLKMDRTLLFYDINTGDEIHYKKKHRPLKVRLLDGTIKTISVDESLSIQQIAEIIGTKMGIGYPEEFSLKVEGSGEHEWLTPTQSLHENKVNEDMILVLKKKFFFNDANVDRSDPVQLHLLYVQCRDAIVDGTHPTQKQEAVQLAAIQLQIDQGTFNPEKHKQNTLPLKSILPPQWLKEKRISSNILKEYRNLANMESENAKFRYIQLCRSLRTYGITTFLVAQKIDRGPKKKPKFYELLIGVTRESIVIMDANTKELKRTFPITHLRRWAPGNRTFTLDFGEYEDDYLTVQTLEGEAISQLIAGYIDIILKRTRNAPRLAQDDDTKTAEEVSVAPIKAQGAEYTTAPVLVDVVNPQGINESMINPGMRMPGVAQPMAQSFQVSEPTLNDALRNIDGFIQNMQESCYVPDDFNPQYCREEFFIKSQGILSKAAQFVQCLSSGEVNLDGLASDIAFDISSIINNAKNLANSSDQDISLIPGALAVSEAINRILQCGKNLRENPNDKHAQMAMKIAQSQLKAAQMLLKHSQNGELIPAEHNELILSSAKALASACDKLFAQSIEYSNGNPKLNAVINYSKTLSDGLLYSARTLSPVINEPECYQQVASLSSTLNKSLQGILSAFKEMGIDPTFSEILSANSSNVSEAIRQLLLSSKLISGGDDPIENLYSATIDISKYATVLINPNTDAGELINGYKEIAKSSSAIVNCSKAIIQTHPALQAKLLPSLKSLAGETRSLLLVAKATAQNPNDRNSRNQLAQGTKSIVSAVGEIKASLAKEMAFAALKRNAILTASNATGLIATSDRIQVSDTKTRQNMDASAKYAKDGVINLIRSIAEISQNPNDLEAQLLLLNHSRNAAHPTSQLISVGKQSLRKIDNNDDRKDLSDACNSLQNILQNLLEAINSVDEIGGGREIKEGIEELENMNADLDSQIIAIDSGFLSPAPGQNQNQALKVLGMSVKALNQKLDELPKTVFNEPSKIGEKVSECTDQVNQVIQAAKTCASLTRGKEPQKNIIHSAVDLTAKTREFFNSIKNSVMDPDNLELQEPVQTTKKDASQSSYNLMNAARGINSAQINSAIESILNYSKQFAIGSSPNFSVGIGELKKSSSNYSATASQIVSSAMTNPKALGSAVNMASQSTQPFIEAVNCAAGLFNDKSRSLAFLKAAQDVTNAMLALIKQATEAAAEENLNSSELTKSNLNLNQSIKNLLNILKPGQAEITQSIESISNAINILDSDDPLIILGNMPLWEIHQSIKNLASSTSNISQCAREQSPSIGNHCKDASDSINNLIHATRLLVNPQENPCTVVASKIINLCNSIPFYSNDRNKVIATTKLLANLTKEAISASKEIRGDENYRQTIVNASQNLGRATGQLGNATKALAMQQPNADQQVQNSSKLLKQQAEQFRDLSLFKDKKPISNELSNDLFNASRSVSSSTSNLINSASLVADDPENYQATSDMSNAISNLQETIGKLKDISSTLATGSKESIEALQNIQKNLSELDKLGISIAAGVDSERSTTKSSGDDLQKIHSDIVLNLRDLASETQNIINNTIDSPEQVGKNILSVSSLIDNISNNTMNVIYSTTDKKLQNNQINKAKGVLQAIQNFIQNTKKANVNPNDDELIQNLHESSQLVKDSITGLGGELQGGMIVLNECDDALRNLQASLKTLNQIAQRDSSTTYQDCQKNIKGHTRLLANSLSTLTTTTAKNPDQIGISSKELSDIISKLIHHTRMASSCITNQPEIQKQLLTNVMNIAKGSAAIIQNSKKIAENSNDNNAHSNLSNSIHSVTSFVSDLLSSVKLGATAERDIELAVDTIGKIKVDLDSAALFAASGQFSCKIEEGRNIESSLIDLKDSLNLLVKNSNSLSDSAKGYQEQFASSSKSTSQLIEKVSYHVKETASLLPDLMSQQSILTGARAVAIAVQQMVLAGKDAQANPIDNNAQKSFDNSIEAVTLACNELSSISESASSDIIVTIRELQKAIREIRAKLKDYESNEEFKGESNATPSTIFECAKGIVSGNGQLLSNYGCNQDDFISAIQKTASHCCSMIGRSKGVRVSCASMKELNSTLPKLDKQLKESILAVVYLFECGKLQRIDDPMFYKQFSDSSETCTTKLNDFVSILKLLPGGKDFSWEDDEDSNLAENELQAAIKAIEEAKNRLLDPSSWFSSNPNAINLGDVANQIVEATKSVAMATQQLVITATDVQNEIVSQGRASSKKMGKVYKKDPAWEEGLISAAKAVAGTTEDLVNFANQNVKGECGEEMLIACVRGVGGATARLVSAAKAKADPFSSAHSSLGTCAKKVAEATQLLAEASKAATEKKVEEELAKKAPTSISFAGLRAKELEEHARIAKLELELERARQNLFQKRKKEYASGGN